MLTFPGCVLHSMLHGTTCSRKQVKGCKGYTYSHRCCRGAGAVPAPQHASTPCLCHPLQAPLDDLLRDFANPRDNDRYFPFARHMDWFDGHSWASGYTVFAAGKNQVQHALCPMVILYASASCCVQLALHGLLSICPCKR